VDLHTNHPAADDIRMNLHLILYEPDNTGVDLKLYGGRLERKQDKKRSRYGMKNKTSAQYRQWTPQLYLASSPSRAESADRKEKWAVR
jgi:hypothetical protein